MKDSVEILGKFYTIRKVSYDEDPIFMKEDIHGYCNTITHEIIICDYYTHPDWAETSEREKIIGTQRLLRHEIIHAFLAESGLQNMTHNEWATDEEIVDWISLQFPKILNACLLSACL